MQTNYQLNQTILGQIYQFTRLYERLNMLPADNRWLQKLSKISVVKSALAAVMLDKTEYGKLDILSPKFNPLSNLDERWHKTYHDYERALIEVPNLFAGTVYDEELLRNVYSIFSELKPSYRTASRILEKQVIENSVFKTVTVKVNTPPEQIPVLMKRFCEWLQQASYAENPLLMAGIAHLNIASIHPFPDGNGRLARLFDNGIMRRNGYRYHEVVSLEEYFLQNFEKYHELIESVAVTGKLTGWLEFYTAGLLAAANQAIATLKRLSGGAIDLYDSKIVDLTPKEADVIEVVVDYGLSSGAEIAARLKVSRQNINAILVRLISHGLVRKSGKGPSTRFLLIS
jgi:Fic family protein